MIVATASWDERRLCDDGGCTGLIGNDGLCRVCGRASKFWGDERRRGMQDDEGGDDDVEAADDGDDGDGDELSARRGARARGSAANDGDGEDRRLCIDGSCTGLQDDDGRCKVCGKVDPDAIGRVRSSATSAAAGARSGDADGDGDDADGAVGAGGAGGDDDAAGGDGDGDGDDRRLCPDGGCTGLLDADGACRVCGRRAEA
ncbi:MAG TPA: hypothetical protein VM261_24750 [Kofleriaceae bacterium]|nr:hypothetical protein [Kofleriaceae bacterium]